MFVADCPEMVNINGKIVPVNVGSISTKLPDVPLLRLIESVTFIAIPVPAFFVENAPLWLRMIVSPTGTPTKVPPVNTAVVVPS